MISAPPALAFAAAREGSSVVAAVAVAVAVVVVVADADAAVDAF